MQTTVANACAASLFTHLYPHSLIAVALHVLAQDGSLLAACINAATLALVDAGIPMADYTVACTAGLVTLPPAYSPAAPAVPAVPAASAASLNSKDGVGGADGDGGGGGGGEDGAAARSDPFLDLNGAEEQELPFLTVATLGAGERVSALVMDSRVPVARLESMLAVGVDGCKQMREILDRVVRARGRQLLSSSTTSSATAAAAAAAADDHI
jgi:exosome complex component RRP41